MTTIQPVNTGTTANDGSGDPLRTAFTKVNDSLKSIRSDLSTAPHAVLVGDSLMQQNTAVGTDKNTYHGPRGFFTWLQIFTGFPFSFEVGNAGSQAIIGDNTGIGGDTVANIVTRLAGDVLARNPDIVFMLAGTNDVTANDTYANIKANLETIYTAILEQGALAVAMPIMPRHPSGADWASSAQRRTHHAVNQWIRDFALSTQGMVLLDAYDRWVDPASANGDARTGFTVDGVHPSMIGAYQMGLTAQSVFAGLIRPARALCYSPSDTYDATYHVHGNMLSNGLFTGTSGTAGTAASGTFATGWQGFRNSGGDATVAGSKTTRTDGLPGDVQQLVVSVSGGGAGAGAIYFATTPTSTTTGVVAGQWYEAQCEIEVSASSGGNSPLNAIYLELDDASTGGSRNRCLQPYSGHKFPDVAWSGILKTPPIQPVSTTGLRFRLIMELDETLTSSVTVRISRASLRRRVTAPVL